MHLHLLNLRLVFQKVNCYKEETLGVWGPSVRQDHQWSPWEGTEIQGIIHWEFILFCTRTSRDAFRTHWSVKQKRIFSPCSQKKTTNKTQRTKSSSHYSSDINSLCLYFLNSKMGIMGPISQGCYHWINSVEVLIIRPKTYWLSN